MNPPRRTLTTALQPPSLSPEAVALIKEGTPKPQTQAPVLTLAEKPRDPVPETRLPTHISELAPSPKPKAQKEKPPELVAMVSMTCRVPAKIPQELLKASSERKLKKLRPFTQQDIVSEALTEWLQKNGYLA